jgi:hypothetical protein
MELLRYQHQLQDFIMGTGESTASITVQTAATYTVTTTNASGCTSLQGSGVAAPKTTPTPVVNVVNNCDGTSTLTATATGTLLWSTGESTASSITVQTAATYTVTTMQVDVQVYKVQALPLLKHPTAPVVNVVNNCDGTSTLTASEYTGTLLWAGESTASITVQTAATYTVTTTNASGCTSLQGSGVAAPKTTPTVGSKCCKQL